MDEISLLEGIWTRLRSQKVNGRDFAHRRLQEASRKQTVNYVPLRIGKVVPSDNFQICLPAPQVALFLSTWLIHLDTVSRYRIDELRSSDGIMPCLLTSDSRICSTCLSL